MTRETSKNELGIFLEARRAELTPREAGLPDGPGHRRVAGLRREEVASLASISTDWYTRIEQGRNQVSAPVLGTLADALHLDDDQRRCLFILVGKPSTPTARPSCAAPGALAFEGSKIASPFGRARWSQSPAAMSVRG